MMLRLIFLGTLALHSSAVDLEALESSSSHPEEQTWRGFLYDWTVGLVLPSQPETPDSESDNEPDYENPPPSAAESTRSGRIVYPPQSEERRETDERIFRQQEEQRRQDNECRSRCWKICGWITGSILLGLIGYGIWCATDPPKYDEFLPDKYPDEFTLEGEDWLCKGENAFAQTNPGDLSSAERQLCSVIDDRDMRPSAPQPWFNKKVIKVCVDKSTIPQEYRYNEDTASEVAQQILDDANAWGRIIDKKFVLTDEVSDDVSKCQKVYFGEAGIRSGFYEDDPTHAVLLETAMLKENSAFSRSEVCRHELGHALGLSHSAHEGDLMQEGGNQSDQLSTNDMNRIYATYARTGKHDGNK